MGKWTRRAVIGAGTLGGGGLVLGIGGIALAPNRLSVKAPGGDTQITTWIKITPDNRTTVLIPHADLGQGVSTALAMMLAEEMDADWNTIAVEEAPALDEYANGYLAQLFALGGQPPAFLQRALGFAMFELASLVPLQITGGSTGVRGTGEFGMRVAGASARDVLIRAAAQRWGVPPGMCQAALSRVKHLQTERSLSFGELATEASRLVLPDSPRLKSFEQWRLVGQPIQRLDLPPKTNGTAVYGIDVNLPGMLYATVAAAPIFGGKLVSVDPAPALAMTGVTRVVKLDDAVAVTADSYWTALKALRALKPVFSDGGHGTVSTATIDAAFAAKLSEDGGKTLHSAGNGMGALANAARLIRAEYSVPLQAHATLEPPNATVRIADGHCEVWSGVQDPLAARKYAATIAGLPTKSVTLHNQPVGGGFGRRLPDAFDFIAQAVSIAKAVSPRPVKLIWSREEDIQHDYYRPAATCRFQGGLDAADNALVWVSHFTGDAGDGAARLAYHIPNQHIAGTDVPVHVRKGYWRSVDHSQHSFFTECFLDELAAAAGRDPYSFRRDMLPATSRQRHVLDLAAAQSDWNTRLPEGQGRGIALVEGFGSIIAEVAEIEILPTRALHVRRVTAAVDCGDLVNPDTAKAQIEGGILFGLSAALYGNITIANGAVQQSNFYDFRVARMADAPQIDVHFIASHAPRGGLGEIGVPPIAAAIGNAVFAASGQRLRRLPFAPQGIIS
jgi:isoquinoline 1-oxidoreductase beta subunit